MIELNGIQISDNNINTKKNVKIYTDEKQLSNVVNKEVHALKGVLKDLHTPIAISSENTTESMAQNVRNIADFVAKAKAAGIADVNGMAVTCIIDDDYSGVGYLYMECDFVGIVLYEDNTLSYIAIIDGAYTEMAIIHEGEANQITSSMLTKGARKPIIFTPSTTEVDEETYQKLLSDDVDVMFKTNDTNPNLCTLTYKIKGGGSTLELSFTCFSLESTILEDNYLYGYRVSITTTTPHKVTVGSLFEGDVLSFFSEAGYLDQSTLSPVLQEIDLTGTDADRKAKLDQFEIDWKALTGASDMTGARFVGKVKDKYGFEYSGVFVWNSLVNFYYAIIGSGSDGGSNSSPIMVTAHPHNGRSYITPILLNQPRIIKAGNTAADIAANKAVIEAYRENLQDLGIYPNAGYQVSVVVTSDGEEYTGTLNIGTGALLSGIVTDVNETHHYPFHIEEATGIVTFDKTNYFLEKTSNEVTEMLDAIKYSYTPVPLTATTSTNKTQLDSFLSKVPNAQIMHCTYKDVYAGTLHKIGTDWFGQLVKNTNNYEDCICIKLAANGTVTEGTTSLQAVNAKLDTIIG